MFILSREPALDYQDSFTHSVESGSMHARIAEISLGSCCARASWCLLCAMALRHLLKPSLMGSPLSRARR